MGYPSYLEDIIERFSSGLEDVRIEVTSDLTPIREKAKLTAILQNCERLLNQLLEIATDPDIKLADEIRRLTEESELLKVRLDKARQVIRELRDVCQKRSDIINERNNRIKSLKEELDIYQNLDKFYDKSFKKDI